MRRPYFAGQNAPIPRSVERLELPPGNYLVGLVGPDSESRTGGGYSGTREEFGRTEVKADLRRADLALGVPLERSPGLALSLVGQPLVASFPRLRQEMWERTAEVFSDAEVLGYSTYAKVHLESTTAVGAAADGDYR